MNPKRVVRLDLVGSLAELESGQSVADRYPGARVRSRSRAGQAKCERGVPGGSPGKAAGGTALEGENPRGASSWRRAKHPFAARDSREGQSLEVGVLRTGPQVRLWEIASD